MLDVAIIGAGVCGLSLARQLHAAGLSCTVFEARSRAGGRVLTQASARTGAALDLGAAWFWPQTEPRVAGLLDALGLASFAQHDTGEALRLSDPNRAPEALQFADGVHAGACRVAGGTGRLIDALVADLPAGSLRFGLRLRALTRRHDRVELAFTADGGTAERAQRIEARRVVLAVPPRLLAERVHFEPALDAALADAMRATPTWMAAQAKAFASYPAPFWRADGHSGNAFADHAQAVLRETWDASGACATGPGVLGGFFALGPAQRASFRVGMSMLIESQFVMLFGAQAGLPEDAPPVVHDWAAEHDTCSALDRESADAPPPTGGHPLLRRAQWDGSLYFGATETASHAAGHLEGALEAASRIARLLASGAASDRAVAASAAGVTDAAMMLAGFSDWVARERAGGPERYRRHLTRLLSTQQYEQITQRALLASVEQVYSEALAQLDALPAPVRGVGVEGGRSALTPAALAPFNGWSKAMLDAALGFNRTSCALSNFPAEHAPTPEQVQAVARDLAAAWREFALQVNDLLIARTAARATARAQEA